MASHDHEPLNGEPYPKTVTLSACCVASHSWSLPNRGDGPQGRKDSIEGVSIGSIQVPGGDVSVGPEVWTCELRAARLPFRSACAKTGKY